MIVPEIEPSFGKGEADGCAYHPEDFIMQNKNNDFIGDDFLICGLMERRLLLCTVTLL